MIVCPRCRGLLGEEERELITCRHCNAVFPLASAGKAEDIPPGSPRDDNLSGIPPLTPEQHRPEPAATGDTGFGAAPPPEIPAGETEHGSSPPLETWSGTPAEGTPPPGAEGPFAERETPQRECYEGKPAGEGEQMVTPAFEAYCFIHPGERAVARCTSCRKYICPSCVKVLAGESYCSLCYTRAPEEKAYVPWEDRKNLGFLNALCITTRDVFARPSRFFERTPSGGNLAQPLLYGLLLTVLGIWLAALWQMLFVVVGLAFSKLGGELVGTEHLVPLSGPALAIVLAPLTAIINLFVYSGLVHLGVLMMRGKRGFAGTFRVICYSSAIALTGIVPFLGPMVGGVWRIVVIILGLRRTQRISGGKAAFAALLPIFLAICFVILLVILLLILLVAAGAEILPEIMKGAFPQLPA